MTQVSRFKLPKNVEERISEMFRETIIKLRNKNDVSLFLEEFLTPTEKTMLSKRLAIAVLLGKGYDYRLIRKVLRVTPSTIARISYWYKYKGKIFQKIVEAIIRDEKWADFWNEIFHFVGKIGIYQKGADWGKRRREVEKEYWENKRKRPL